MKRLQLAQKQSGFGHVLVVVALLVFGAIGAIGYAVYSQQSGADNTAVLTPAISDKADTPTAPQIKSEADLDRAVKTLDNVDPAAANQADEAQLADQLDDF